ncbi:MAG: tetratricopeptide repeat protein [Thermodesulfobacteriota bacterium]
MGLFRIFSGKTPEEHEQSGDAYARGGAFGEARLEFEKALQKIERKFPEKAPLSPRLAEKYQQASESLARSHQKEADALADAGDQDAAGELYHLALDLTGDEALKKHLSDRLQRMHQEHDTAETGALQPDPADPDAGENLADPEEAPELSEESAEEIFSVLCHALPEDLEAAYRSYGEAFKAGYIALNQGDFETALEQLSLALEENADAPGLIALELATAYIHLDDHDHARYLLERFIEQNPEEIRAYQLLCEIYWERGDYTAADDLLAACPDAIQNAKAILLLTGETRFQEKDMDAAEAAFIQYIDIHGEDEIVCRALAKTRESRGDLDSAKELYAQIINQCSACGAMVDPFLKRRYAELSFESGDLTAKLLDIYLGLVREDPDNRGLYFHRIARIYENQGESREAHRYDAFARQSA